MSDKPRERTKVYVTRAPHGPVPRWVVRVRYADAKPTSLVSTPDHAEAIRMMRRYAAKYGWLPDYGDGGEL